MMRNIMMAIVMTRMVILIVIMVRMIIMMVVMGMVMMMIMITTKNFKRKIYITKISHVIFLPSI